MPFQNRWAKPPKQQTTRNTVEKTEQALTILETLPRLDSGLGFGDASGPRLKLVGKAGGQTGGQKLPNTGQNRATRIT